MDNSISLCVKKIKKVIRDREFVTGGRGDNYNNDQRLFVQRAYVVAAISNRAVTLRGTGLPWGATFSGQNHLNPENPVQKTIAR